MSAGLHSRERKYLLNGSNQVGRDEGGGDMDWMIKGRLLVMGCILIVLGLVVFAVRGVEAALVLPAIGIVLLVAGVIYKPRQKKP